MPVFVFLTSIEVFARVRYILCTYTYAVIDVHACKHMETHEHVETKCMLGLGLPVLVHV